MMISSSGRVLSSKISIQIFLALQSRALLMASRIASFGSRKSRVISRNSLTATTSGLARFSCSFATTIAGSPCKTFPQPQSEGFGPFVAHAFYRVKGSPPQLREARLRFADGGVEGAAGHEGGLRLDAGGEQVAPELPGLSVVGVALADEAGDVAGAAGGAGG